MNGNHELATGAIVPESHQWAVVCTGFIDREYNVTPIQDAKGNRFPVIVRLFPDKAKADTMFKRLQSRHSKVGEFLDREWSAGIPIYGIAETDLPVGKKRQKNPNAFGRAAETEAATPNTAGPGRKGRKSA